MSEQETNAAVAVRETYGAAATLSDDEIRRTYRIAEALYASGAWQLKNAEAAFAKIAIGHDLGLSPAQAMQGIHIVDGGVQTRYAQIGQFIRAREGYDYRAGWTKEEPVLDVGTRDEATGEVRPTVPPLAVVAPEDEEPTDLRRIVGAYAEILVDGERRGISRFTLDDAKAAGLAKPDKPRAAWNAAPRNMLLARAMSNGAKWFVPEVFGGMPVYAEGEVPERKSTTAAVGDGDDDGSGIDLGPKVDATIADAEALGHRGLSNRAAVELAVGKRSPGVVNDWVKAARAELDRFAQEKAAAEATAGDPQADAVVVEEAAVPEPEEEATAEPVEEPRPEDLPDPDGSDTLPVDDPQARLDAHLAAEEDREEER